MWWYLDLTRRYPPRESARSSSGGRRRMDDQQLVVKSLAPKSIDHNSVRYRLILVTGIYLSSGTAIRCIFCEFRQRFDCVQLEGASILHRNGKKKKPLPGNFLDRRCCSLVSRSEYIFIPFIFKRQPKRRPTF